MNNLAEIINGARAQAKLAHQGKVKMENALVHLMTAIEEIEQRIKGYPVTVLCPECGEANDQREVCDAENEVDNLRMECGPCGHNYRIVKAIIFDETIAED